MIYRACRRQIGITATGTQAAMKKVAANRLLLKEIIVLSRQPLINDIIANVRYIITARKNMASTNSS